MHVHACAYMHVCSAWMSSGAPNKHRRRQDHHSHAHFTPAWLTAIKLSASWIACVGVTVMVADAVVPCSFRSAAATPPAQSKEGAFETAHI